jgi:polyisoprenoid-binding protein YceI
MDIRQITNTDMPADKGGDKLIGHLKGEDFFEVEKYPMASFTITKVQPVSETTDGTTHEISGDLTLKGETRNVTIPTTVSMDGGQFKATTPKFTINRLDWGIVYGNSAIEGLTKDKVISNDVGLELMIVANK